MLKDIGLLCVTLALFGFGAVYLAARGPDGLIVSIASWAAGVWSISWFIHSRHHKKAIEDIEISTDLAVFRAQQEELKRLKAEERAKSRVA